MRLQLKRSIPVFLLLSIVLLACFSFRIPQVYAVSTFGYTSIGGTSADHVDGFIYGCKFSLLEDGDVTKITAYLDGKYGSTPNSKTAIYSDNAGVPNALLASSNVVAVTADPSWIEYTISVSLVAGTYWLATMIDGATGVAIRYYDAGSANQRYNSNGYTYPNFPNPFDADFAADENISIYATYTEAGGQSLTFTSQETLKLTDSLISLKSLQVTQTGTCTITETSYSNKAMLFTKTETIIVTDYSLITKSLVIHAFEFINSETLRLISYPTSTFEIAIAPLILEDIAGLAALALVIALAALAIGAVAWTEKRKT